MSCNGHYKETDMEESKKESLLPIMEERQRGWYRVKYRDAWWCAWYTGNSWTLNAYNGFMNSSFDKIGDKIEMPL